MTPDQEKRARHHFMMLYAFLHRADCIESFAAPTKKPGEGDNVEILFRFSITLGLEKYREAESEFLKKVREELNRENEMGCR